MNKKPSGKKKEESAVLSIDKLREATTKSKNELDTFYKKACDKAFDTVTSDAYSRMKEAGDRGRERVYLYEWHFLDDPKDDTFSFGNVKMLDIVRKGDLILRLKDLFNPDNDPNGYFVGWHKFQRKQQNEPNRYGIYVSWRVRTPQHESQE